MTKRQLANQRLHEDIDDAITILVAELARRDNGYTGAAKVIMDERSSIRDRVVAALKRNWRVSERARGERST